MPHCWSGPRSATNPRAATTAWAGRRTGSWPSTVISTSDTVGSPYSPVTWALVMISEPESRTVCTERSWARKASRRWTRVIELRDRLEVDRPVERRVAAADDHDVLSGVRREAGHEELHPAPSQPSPAGRGRGLNLPMPAVIRSAFAVTSLPSSRVIVTSSSALVEPGGGAVEQVLRLGGVRLLDERVDEIAALDRGEARDVEDLLLRIHRGDLAAQLRERVDDGDAETAEAGVVGGEQPGRARADDRQVGVVVWHGATLPHRSVRPRPSPRRVRSACTAHRVWTLATSQPRSRVHHRHQRPAGGVRRGPAAGDRALVQEEQRQHLVGASHARRPARRPGSSWPSGWRRLLGAYAARRCVR